MNPPVPTYSAAIGAADLHYNTAASVLEGSAKLAGLNRAAQGQSARELEMELVEYEGRGTWLFLSVPGASGEVLPGMIAVPMAKALKRALTVVVVGPSGARTQEVLPGGKKGESGVDLSKKGETALERLGLTDVAVLHRQKRRYFYKPTTGNARLDRFIESVRTAESVDIQKEPDGRFCIRLMLPGGIKQMSFFSAEETEWVKKAQAGEGP